MKSLIIVAGLLTLSSAFAAPSKIVDCIVKIDKRGERLSLKLNSKDELSFYSKNKIVDAPKGSYFEFLTNVENFGLEGRDSYKAPNGYRILSVINTAEAVDIGLAEDNSKGFYSYRDGGSGLGNLRLDLTCKQRK